MNIHVYIKPGSKEQKVTKKEDLLGEIIYELRVKALPKEGEANKELVEVLAEYFNVSKSLVKIVSGFKSRNKIVFIQKI